ncbi:TetR/AcrR family transcriptional regulator C-terminal domain-containing protein [Escherichia coli]|nr:TetR/AcrR family transcriptional regulator C-terminal domain-containing protein [Escherichia coli]
MNEVGVDGLTTRKLAERLGVQQPALYWHFRNKRALLDALAEAMLAENHTHSVPRADDDWRSFLIGNARSFRQALLAYRDGARIHAGTRPGAPQMETVRRAASLPLRGGFFSTGDAVNALMTISYFTVGAVLEEQAGDSDAGERGGTVEQAPLSPLLRAAIDAFDEAGPDAAFEQGLAVIVDGLAKRRLVVRNVEGPRKGDD